MQLDISKLKNKADAGDSDAAFAIFDAYENAKIDKEAAWEAAMYYLNLAAEKENPDALLAMGRLLIAGTKIDKDVDKGMALLQRAKQLGNKDVDDVVSALEIELDEPDHDQAEHDNSEPETENAEVDDKVDAKSADNPDMSDDDNNGDSDDDDDDDSQPAPASEKAEKKNKGKADIGKSNNALTSDQLMRMIKTKLAQLEKNETMSATHHFDILKITIDDSENIKELQAINDVLDKPAYVKTLHEQNQLIIGWNAKQGVFYLDTGASDDVSDDIPLSKRSYQRGEVRNLIYAGFITIVVLIIFLNLLYAVRPF